MGYFHRPSPNPSNASQYSSNTPEAQKKTLIPSPPRDFCRFLSLLHIFKRLNPHLRTSEGLPWPIGVRPKVYHQSSSHVSPKPLSVFGASRTLLSHLITSLIHPPRLVLSCLEASVSPTPRPTPCLTLFALPTFRRPRSFFFDLCLTFLL